jgi:hypothetical protein
MNPPLMTTFMESIDLQLTSRTADLRCRLINTAGRPSQPGQADWGFRLQGARNKVLTLHAVPNVCFSY